MSVVDGVRKAIEAVGDAADPALAATALELAAGLDSHNSLTSKSMAAKALADVLKELRSMAPPKQEKDRADEIAERRKRRLARAAG